VIVHFPDADRGRVLIFAGEPLGEEEFFAKDALAALDFPFVTGRDGLFSGAGPRSHTCTSANRLAFTAVLAGRWPRPRVEVALP
jgi:hypothetical protein